MKMAPRSDNISILRDENLRYQIISSLLAPLINMRWHLCILGNALILAGWASPYAQVSHVDPHLTGVRGVGFLAAAEQTLTKAMQEEHAKPLVGRPSDEAPLSPRVREYFQEELFFRYRPEIGRAIFIASPLRDSNLATGLIGKLSAMIIREATLSSQGSREMVRLTGIEKAELKPMRRSNSVDSLSPRSRFLNAMNTIRVTPGVPYNTIIGGRGDSPNSSDGVVPYWSSHMNGAQSECIVP
jgi:hypothetical protein